MSHSHVEPHTHDHNTEHCHLSAKYTEYIKIHLDDLKSKCSHLTACINKLLSQQSAISVLKGDDLSLKKICKLINNNSTEPIFDGKCSPHDSIDIRDDVESHLRDKIGKRDSWESVDRCLENSYGDNERTTYVKEICGLAEKTQDTICSEYSIHKQIEKFVNEQIEHLHCTCKSIHLNHDDHSHSHLSTPLLIGLGVGGFVLLCIVLGLVFYLCKRRKNKKSKKKPNVIYLPAPNADGCSIYQEIFDPMTPPLSPPALPSRQGSNALPRIDDDSNEYLEPVHAHASYRAKAPLPLVNNPGYRMEAPPEYSETDQNYDDADHRNSDRYAYFQPIATPKEKSGEGYDTLNKEEDDNSSIPEQYAPLAEDADRPLGPVPAKRTKKQDRNNESEYFELEREVEF